MSQLGNEDKSSMIPTSLGGKFIPLKPITFDRAFEGHTQVRSLDGQSGVLLETVSGIGYIKQENQYRFCQS